MDKEKKPWRAEMHNAMFFPLSGANRFRRGHPKKIAFPDGWVAVGILGGDALVVPTAGKLPKKGLLKDVVNRAEARKKE